MPNLWPRVPLGEIAGAIERAVVPVPGTVYRQVGVKLWGQGAYERETLDGSQTSYKTLSRVEAGDIIVNKIWARNGSVAVIPEPLAGGYVSGEFPTFVPDAVKLDARWFHWFTKTKGCWEQCDDKSRGTSGKNRIRPERFLEIEIPLPPLDEQRRIVARIEQLAAKIQEARGLRQQSINETKEFLPLQAERTFEALSRQHPKRNLASFEPHVTSGPRNWGPRHAESGLRFYRAQDIGSDSKLVGTCKMFIVPPNETQGANAKLRPGDLMMVITGATVGRCAVFPAQTEPGFVNQHVALCRLPATELFPYYVLWGLRAPSGRGQLLGQRYGQGKPGLNLSNIRAITLPFPPIEDQRRIVAYLDGLQAKVDALKKLQAETAAELDALMPSILAKAFRGEM